MATASIRITGDVKQALAALDELGIRAEEIGKKTENAFGEAATKTGNLFQKLGQSMGNFGLPFSESVSKMGDKLSETETKGQKAFQALSSVGGAALLGIGSAAVAAGVEAVRLGENYQQATAGIAASANISQAAATEIGKAFLTTAGQTTFSAQQIAQAYSGVAGQLGATQGRALTAKEALGVMTAATNLAEASGSDLGATTSSLAKIMQAYQIGAAGAAGASDVLFNTSRLTDQSLETVTQTATRLKTNLGDLAPSLGDTAGLMVDLTQHGETGRQAVSAVGSALQTLLSTTKPTQVAAKDLTAYQDAVAKAGIAVADAQIRLRDAQEKEAGKPTQVNIDAVTLAQNNLTAAQLAAKDAQDKLNTAMAPTPQKLTAAQVEANNLGITLFNTKGQFVGMGDVIAQLQPKLERMTSAQQMAAAQALFGSSADRKLLDTILAGPQAYDAATAAVTRQNSAHEAAEKQAATLRGSIEKLKSQFEDYGAKIGIALIPKLEMLGQDTANVINWFDKHKVAAEALAGVIGGVLSVAVAAFTVNKLAAMVRGISDAVGAIGRLGSAAAGVIAKIAGLGTAEATEGAEAATAATEEDALAVSETAVGTAAAASIPEVAGLDAAEAGGGAAGGIGAAGGAGGMLGQAALAAGAGYLAYKGTTKVLDSVFGKPGGTNPVEHGSTSNTNQFYAQFMQSHQAQIAANPQLSAWQKSGDTTDILRYFNTHPQAGTQIAISNLNITSQNPDDMARQLQQKARTANLAGGSLRGG